MSRRRRLKRGVRILIVALIASVVGSMISVNLGAFCFTVAFWYGLLYLLYIIYVGFVTMFAKADDKDNSIHSNESFTKQDAETAAKSKVVLHPKTYVTPSTKQHILAPTSKSVEHEHVPKVENRSLPLSTSKKDSLPETASDPVSSRRENAFTSSKGEYSNEMHSYHTRKLFQDRHFHFEPLEGNVPQNIVEAFEKTVEEANRLMKSHDDKQQTRGMLLVMHFPDGLPKRYRSFVDNYITSSMFNGVSFLNDPRFNTLHSYDFYGWRIVETNQVFLIDLVTVGEKPELRTLDSTYMDYYKHIANDYNIEPFLIESNVPGAKAQKELEAICHVAEGCGNLLLNRGHAFECDYYFDIKTRDTVQREQTYKYLSTPVHLVSQFDYLYCGLTKPAFQWDNVNLDKLKSCGLGKQFNCVYSMFLKRHYKRISTNQKKYGPIFEKYESFVLSQIKEKVGGHIYKSVGKRSRCVLVLTDITERQFKTYKEKGLEVYHAFDVLRKLKVWEQFQEYINS